MSGEKRSKKSAVQEGSSTAQCVRKCDVLNLIWFYATQAVLLLNVVLNMAMVLEGLHTGKAVYNVHTVFWAGMLVIICTTVELAWAPEVIRAIRKSDVKKEKVLKAVRFARNYNLFLVPLMSVYFMIIVEIQGQGIAYTWPVGGCVVMRIILSLEWTFLIRKLNKEKDNAGISSV